MKNNLFKTLLIAFTIGCSVLSASNDDDLESAFARYNNDADARAKFLSNNPAETAKLFDMLASESVPVFRNSTPIGKRSLIHLINVTQTNNGFVLYLPNLSTTSSPESIYYSVNGVEYLKSAVDQAVATSTIASLPTEYHDRLRCDGAATTMHCTFTLSVLYRLNDLGAKATSFLEPVNVQLRQLVNLEEMNVSNILRFLDPANPELSQLKENGVGMVVRDKLIAALREKHGSLIAIADKYNGFITALREAGRMS